MSRFHIDVADLLSHAGARRTVRLTEPIDGLANWVSTVADPVTVDLRLDRISEGIVARGSVTAIWQADCSRCLTELSRPVSVHVDELFETDPVPDETYPIEGHAIDLDQLIRDAILLELPLAPHCEPPCTVAGLTDADDDEAPDPRWAALSELEL